MTHRAVVTLALLWSRSGRPAPAEDPSWPKEMTFALLSTENAAEITRRWAPVLAQLEKDLGVKIKPVTATDYRGTIEALKFKKAELGHLGPEGVRRGVEQQLRQRGADRPAPARQRLARLPSCLIVHADSDIFSPEDIGGEDASPSTIRTRPPAIWCRRPSS